MPRISSRTSRRPQRGRRLGVELHAPGLDLREIEEVVDELQQVLAAAADVARGSAGASPTAASRGGPRGSAEKPMIELSGVRSSWLMLERNTLLARLASSARASDSWARRSDSSSWCTFSSSAAVRSVTRSSSSALARARERSRQWSKASTRRHQRRDVEEDGPPGAPERRGDAERDARALLVPHAVVVGGDHREAVAARRQVRVVRRAPRAGIDPVAVETLRAGTGSAPSRAPRSDRPVKSISNRSRSAGSSGRPDTSIGSPSTRTSSITTGGGRRLIFRSPGSISTEAEDGREPEVSVARRPSRRAATCRCTAWRACRRRGCSRSSAPRAARSAAEPARSASGTR